MTQVSPSPSLHRRIRQRTAPAHAALENTPMMRAFDSDSLSVKVYGSYLSLQWRLHAPLEALLAHWLPVHWAALRLRKGEWLLEDLQAVGMHPVEPIAAPSGIESWAHALGVLYVLEGSTLGLQVVRKRLQDKHPALQSAGRFMFGYGEQTGRHWLEFLASLEALAEVDWPLAEEAACATFEHFLQAFSQIEPESFMLRLRSEDELCKLGRPPAPVGAGTWLF